MNKSEVEHYIDMALGARKAAEKRKEKHLEWLEERYKKMYFNAGRYVAGDRDRTCTQAYKQFIHYEKLESYKND